MSAKETKQPKELSQEQLEQLRDKQMKVMEDQLPYLRVEEEYNRLQASIEKSRFEQMFYKIKWAEIKLGQNQQPKNSEDKK